MRADRVLVESILWSNSWWKAIRSSLNTQVLIPVVYFCKWLGGCVGGVLTKRRNSSDYGLVIYIYIYIYIKTRWIQLLFFFTQKRCSILHYVTLKIYLVKNACWLWLICICVYIASGADPGLKKKGGGGGEGGLRHFFFSERHQRQESRKSQTGGGGESDTLLCSDTFFFFFKVSKGGHMYKKGGGGQCTKRFQKGGGTGWVYPPPPQIRHCIAYFFTIWSKYVSLYF